MRAYIQLKASGLPIDWMTIYIGWQGIRSYIDNIKLTNEEIIESALDQVGCGTEKQDSLSALLACVNPADWHTVKRYLDELAATETVSRELALRKWRFVSLAKYLDNLDIAHIENIDFNDVVWDIQMRYEDFVELPDSKLLLPSYSTNFVAEIQKQREWLKSEKQAIIEICKNELAWSVR